MATTPPIDDLAEGRYVTFFLRVAVDEEGRLLSGELADLARGVTLRRFAAWNRLSAAVRACLTEERLSA